MNTADSPRPVAKHCLHLAPVILVWTLWGTAGAQETTYETPPTLFAPDVLSAEALAGPHHRVADRIPTDGFLTHVTVDSDFGTFEAVGPGMLDVRLREIEALAQLQTIAESDEFKAGAKHSSDETAAGIRSFVEKPKETLEGIPEGIGRFFKRTARAAKTGIQKIDDMNQGRAPGAPIEDGPGARLPGGPSAAPGDAPPQADIYKATAHAAGQVALNALGYDDARRRLAKRLGVDPYTTNPVLAKKLDEVAKAAFTGGLTVDLVTSLVPGGRIVQTSTRLSDWVWDTPPGDLRVEIERTLLGMGIAQTDVDLLLRHRWYPLSLQAALAKALADLEGVEGRAEVMPLALTVASEEQARFLVGTLRMTARYHREVKPLKSVAVLGTLVATATDGELVVAAPVDYLSWTEALDRFVSQEGLTAPNRSIHLAGHLTDRARAGLGHQGWSVIENSALFAAP
jgi:hypothetical protein